MSPYAPIHIYVPVSATRNMPTNWSPRAVVRHHLPDTMEDPQRELFSRHATTQEVSDAR